MSLFEKFSQALDAIGSDEKARDEQHRTAAAVNAQAQQAQVQMQQMQNTYNDYMKTATATIGSSLGTLSGVAGSLGSSMAQGLSNITGAMGQIGIGNGLTYPGQVISTTTAPSYTFTLGSTAAPATYPTQPPQHIPSPILSDRDKRILDRLRHLEQLWRTSHGFHSAYSYDPGAKATELQTLAILELAEEIKAKNALAAMPTDSINALMAEVYGA